jgi:hypothetical protein
MTRRLPAESAFARSLVRAGRLDRPGAGARERALEHALHAAGGRSRGGWGTAHVSAAVSLAAIAFVLAVGTRASAADACDAHGATSVDAAHRGALVTGSAGGSTLENRTTTAPTAAIERASSLDGPPSADRGAP